VKLSRQGVTRIRNKLVEEELLRNICIPRLYRWGFEIYAVAHPRFRLEVGWDKRIRSQPKDIMERSFYVLSKADESVGNFMVPKFTEYSEKLENVLAWYHKVKAFEDPPELNRSTELRNFDFAPAVSRLLAPQKE
jgi:hypothetical protein